MQVKNAPRVRKVLNTTQPVGIKYMNMLDRTEISDWLFNRTREDKAQARADGETLHDYQIAKDLGTSAQNLSRWISGKLVPVEILVFVQMARRWDEDICELFRMAEREYLIPKYEKYVEMLNHSKSSKKANHRS